MDLKFFTNDRMSRPLGGPEGQLDNRLGVWGFLFSAGAAIAIVLKYGLRALFSSKYDN